MHAFNMHMLHQRWTEVQYNYIIKSKKNNKHDFKNSLQYFMLALVSAEKRRMLNNKNMLRIFGYMRIKVA